ncbi:rubrerythrin [Candidatus Wirthbacteria bacterium CG2_30_54_11]|uniref:Rubrerythrin n=1 Tax=Candidatus Wirthbacteria bacterium CG2_30_54_11 TaxID=1817892 RepID=A0A1J5IWF8_9BACT|nr:MAG: rubrerythrin [Candidatus Wirthbacteria bacterium CG2_30_54_11]
MPKALDDLMAAFAGESQANRKYLSYARKAEEDGYPQAAKLFRAAAHAETVHALNHFRAAGEIKTTTENLQTAIAGENYEVTSMYPAFIKDAEAEFHKNAVRSFKLAYEVEQVHESLYREMAGNLEEEGKESYSYFVCPVCGYTHARRAPDSCPVCGIVGGKFEKID